MSENIITSVPSGWRIMGRDEMLRDGDKFWRSDKLRDGEDTTDLDNWRDTNAAGKAQSDGVFGPYIRKE